MAGRVKVLLLSVFPKVEKKLVDMLRAVPAVEMVEHDVNNAEAALELMQNTTVDVVLLEADFPGMDGFYFTEMIRKRFPFTQVVVLSEISSAEAVRLAMRAGACDFLSYKNMTTDELAAAIEHAYGLSDEARRKVILRSDEERTLQRTKQVKKDRAKVVALYSPKGGVGVSTVAANLGQVLKSRGNDVLLLDGSLQFGDLAIMFNQFGPHSLSDILGKEMELDADMIENITVEASVDIIPAPSHPEHAIRLSSAGFANVIKQVSTLMNYDYVLINTSSYLTDACFTALEAADLVVLVVVQEISAVRAARSFLNLMDNLEVPRGKFLLVLNRYDKSITITPQRVGEILSHDVATTIPADYETAIRAANLGIPFVIDYKSLPVSKSVFGLADLLAKKIIQVENLGEVDSKEAA